MIQGGDAGGYTIVETMVFLAVTAILFASAIGLISGRQQNVQFSQSVRDAQSKLQDVINQVSAGFYPNTGTFTCDVDVTNPTARPTFNPAPVTPDAQGSSSKCVFLGKVIQLGADINHTNFNIYTVASRRLTKELKEVDSLQKALPTAIAPSSVLPNIPDMTEKGAFQFGLRVDRVTVPDAAGNYVGASADFGSIAFFGSFPSVSITDPATFASGAQHVSYGVVPLTNINEPVYSAVDHINAMTSDAASASYTKLSPDLSLANGVVICLSDQGGGRKAKLTIGGGVSDTSVKLDIGAFAVCP